MTAAVADPSRLASLAPQDEVGGVWASPQAVTTLSSDSRRHAPFE
jgi:hypothetical protein